MGQLLLSTKQEFALQRIADGHAVCHNVAIACSQMLHQLGFGTHHVHSDRTTDTTCVCIRQLEQGAIPFAVELKIALRTIEGENDEFTICLDAIEVETLRSIGGTKYAQLARFLLLATNDYNQYYEDDKSSVSMV